MIDFVQEALTSTLGKTARFWRYDREIRTPMNFVLDEVERQIGPLFSVYWVDGGHPEVFCLPGFSPSPVVFSTRYLSLTSFIRHLFVDDWLTGVLDDVAERTTLKLIAEMALRHGDPDFAVLAFIKSVTGKGIWLNDEDQLMALEHGPIHEAYMATWFYGLLHELGHLHPNQSEQFTESHIFSNAGILDAITVALNDFSAYPDWLKNEALKRVKQERSHSVLAIDHLRREGLADVFAASVLFKTTFDIMRKVNQERFVSVKFIPELLIFSNIVAIIDRCRRIASIASAKTANKDAQFEGALHPVSMMVRGSMQRAYLDSAIATYLDADSTSQQLRDVGKLINGIHESFRERVNVVDSSLARAMEFSLFPERRENDWALLEAFRIELPKSTLSLLEARRFCEMADGLEVDGKLLKALKSILDKPGKPLRPDPIGDLIYFVPWIEGPNGVNRPFGLDTKHGHLVFVFQTQGEVYDAFFKPSAESLKPGFALKRAAVAVPRKERLGPELAANMPADQPFQIIVEGTEEFSLYMKELGDDSIWGN